MKSKQYFDLSEITEVTAKNTGIEKEAVKMILENAIAAIKSNITQRGFVGIHDFGTFTLVERKATTKRNPNTGEPIQVPKKNSIKFRPSTSFKASHKDLSGLDLI